MIWRQEEVRRGRESSAENANDVVKAELAPHVAVHTTPPRLKTKPENRNGRKPDCCCWFAPPCVAACDDRPPSRSRTTSHELRRSVAGETRARSCLGHAGPKRPHRRRNRTARASSVRRSSCRSAASATLRLPRCRPGAHLAHPARDTWRGAWQRDCRGCAGQSSRRGGAMSASGGGSGGRPAA